MCRNRRLLAVLIVSMCIGWGGVAVFHYLQAKNKVKLNELRSQNKAFMETISVNRTDIEALEKKTAEAMLVVEAQKTQIEALRERMRRAQANAQAESEKWQVASADSVYNQLRRVVYPANGDDLYPFNEIQIREINQTHLLSVGLRDQNLILREQVGVQESIIDTQSDIIEDKTAQVGLLNQNSLLYEQIIDNKNEEIQVLTVENRRQKRSGVAWKGVSGVLAIVVILLAL